MESKNWYPIGTAPLDGTHIEVKYEDGSTEKGVYWQKEGRCCMLGARAGSYPAGFTSSGIGHLPVEGIIAWRPEA